jgi:hypothetical protein
MRNFWKAKPKPKEIMESSFQSLIQKAIENEGGTVNIYRYDPESPTGAFASKISPFDSDVKDWKDRDVSAYLNQVHGGGRYRVQINYKQKDGKLIEAKQFDYSIGGEAKEGGYTESRKAKQAETQQVTEIFKTAIEFAKEVKGGDGGNAALIQALIIQNTELQKQNSQNMMEMQKQYNQLVLKVSMDKETGGGMSEIISNMMQMEEFKSMLQPKALEQNETLEMIKAIAPIAGTILAGRQGIQPQVESKEPLTMIEAPHPKQDINMGSPQPDRITPAGNSQQIEATPSEIKIPNGTNVKRDEFEVVMLDPLVDLVDSGATPEEIAGMIQIMLNHSFIQVRLQISPHAVMLPMVIAITQAIEGKADMATIEKAYSDFAHSIEMPDELIGLVKDELLKIYLPLILNAQAQAKAQATQGGVVNVADTTE